MTETHYSSAVGFVNTVGVQLGRQVTVSIGTTGDVPQGNTITVTMEFNATSGVVEYRGGSISDWTCDPIPDQAVLTSMTCSRVQTGETIPPIIFSLHGVYPGVSVLVTATNNIDDAPANTRERACSWSDPSDCPPY